MESLVSKKSMISISQIASNYHLKHFVIIVFATITFFMSLHPITGSIGGFVFILFGWLIPTGVNFLISNWLSMLLTKVKYIRILILITISIILGINTKFSNLFINRSDIRTNVSIIRPIKLYNGLDVKRSFSRELYSKVYVAENPLLPAIQVGFNEGCMCMYWKGNKEALFNSIESYKHGSSDTTNPENFLRIDVKDKSSTIDVEITIYTNKEIVASLGKVSIPYIDISDRISKGQISNLDNGYFWKNSFEIFIHNNFWSYMLSPFCQNTNFFDIRNFYDQSMVSFTKEI